MSQTSIPLRVPQSFSYIFLILTLAPVSLLNALMIDLYMPIMPLIAEQLNYSFQQVQVSLTLPLFIGGISQIFWGFVFDRFGLKKTLYSSVIIFILGCIFSLMYSDYSIFLLGRLFQAIGANGIQLFGLSLAKLTAQDDQRGTLMTQMIGLSGTAPIFAPLLGSLLTYYWGNWQGIFAFLAIYSLSLGFVLACSYHSVIKSIDAQKRQQQKMPSKPLFSRLGSILRDRLFFQGLWIPPLMLLGLILFFSFNSFYLQSVLALDPWIYRALTGLHAFIYVSSSLILGPRFSQNPEKTLRTGLWCLFGLYLYLFVMSTISSVPLAIFAICTLSMAPFYAVMYGLSFSYALKNIQDDPGLATAILGTYQFSLVSLITTFAFGNGNIGISDYARPLLIMSLIVLFMQYYGHMILEPKKCSQTKGL